MSRFFFVLEKRNYINKTMRCVILQNGDICKEQKKIVQEQCKFYEELYTSNPEISFNIANDMGILLTNEQRTALDLPITGEELDSALFSMKPNKVPGLDGLSKEFMVHFWHDLRESFLAMVSEVLNDGLLSLSTRSGLISLLPKKNKDTRFIKNLRPLTLLNLDYKIIAKTLANRLKKVLPDIIGEQQT